MRRSIHISLLLCCCWWSTSVWAQSPRSDSSEVIKQLLSMPAPIPRTTETPTLVSNRKERPESFYSKENPPPEDAESEDLIEYWERWKHTQDRPQPSTTVQQRLIEACVDDFSKITDLLPLFESSEQSIAKVKELFDKAPSDPEYEDERDDVREWLVLKSKYFLNELLARANKVKDNEEDGDIEDEESLEALAKLDWSSAEPLLRGLATTGGPRSSAFAIKLLYEHAISTNDTAGEEKFRTELQTIVSDRSARGYARDLAIEILSLTKWSGRDDWYLSLFTDNSLIDLEDGVYGFSPLDTLVGLDPDKWIPIMTKMVGSTNRTIQQSAAACLVRYAKETPRRDAILPVLRWLSDPDWIQISDSDSPSESGFTRATGWYEDPLPVGAANQRTGDLAR